MSKPKPISVESLEILSRVGEIRETKYPQDASDYLQRGAILIGVAKVRSDEDDCLFRYSLGWPLDRGEPPWIP